MNRISKPFESLSQLRLSYIRNRAGVAFTQPHVRRQHLKLSCMIPRRSAFVWPLLGLAGLALAGCQTTAHPPAYGVKKTCRYVAQPYAPYRRVMRCSDPGDISFADPGLAQVTPSPPVPEPPTPPERPDRPDKPDKPDRPDKPDKPDRPDKPDKPDRPDKPDKPDHGKPDKPDKPDHGKPDRPGHGYGDKNHDHTGPPGQRR